ncbi:MAG: DUF6768 family protein [Phycisphaerales bacterium]
MNGHEEARRIGEALRAEAERGARDDSMVELMVGTFRGRRKWFTALVWLMTGVMFAGSVVCAVKFFDAAETREQIAWATGFVYFSLAVLGMKIWAWMEMLHGSTAREVKRVEAMLARLAEAVGGR